MSERQPNRSRSSGTPRLASSPSPGPSSPSHLPLPAALPEISAGVEKALPCSNVIGSAPPLSLADLRRGAAYYDGVEYAESCGIRKISAQEAKGRA